MSEKKTLRKGIDVVVRETMEQKSADGHTGEVLIRKVYELLKEKKKDSSKVSESETVDMIRKSVNAFRQKLRRKLNETKVDLPRSSSTNSKSAQQVENSLDSDVESVEHGSDEESDSDDASISTRGGDVRESNCGEVDDENRRKRIDQVVDDNVETLTGDGFRGNKLRLELFRKLEEADKTNRSETMKELAKAVHAWRSREYRQRKKEPPLKPDNETKTGYDVESMSDSLKKSNVQSGERFVLYVSLAKTGISNSEIAPFELLELVKSAQLRTTSLLDVLQSTGDLDEYSIEHLRKRVGYLDYTGLDLLAFTLGYSSIRENGNILKIELGKPSFKIDESVKSILKFPLSSAQRESISAVINRLHRFVHIRECFDSRDVTNILSQNNSSILAWKNEEKYCIGLAIFLSGNDQSELEQFLNKQDHTGAAIQGNPDDWIKLHRFDVIFSVTGDFPFDPEQGSFQLVLSPEEMRSKEAFCKSLSENENDLQNRAFPALIGALELLGIKYIDHPNQVQLRWNKVMEDALPSEERKISICLDVAVLNPSRALEPDAGSEMLIDNQPKTFHAEQQRAAKELLHSACKALKVRELRELFDDVIFRVITTDTNALEVQTLERVQQCGLTSGLVLSHRSFYRSEMEDIRQNISDRTLLVLIFDDCLHPLNKIGYDNFLLPEIPADAKGELNVLKLLVSATPIDSSTVKSSIPKENVFEWSTPSLLYVGVEHYCETVTWAVPHQVKDLEVLIGRSRVEKVDSGGFRFRFPLHEYQIYHDILNDLLEKANLPFRFALGGDSVTEVCRLDSSTSFAKSAFEVGTGLLWWLGYEENQYEHQDSQRFRAQNPPRLCNFRTAKNISADLKPRNSQRILGDFQFRSLRMKLKRQFNQRFTPMQRLGNASPLLDSHFLMADYLLSFAFLAVFRIASNLDLEKDNRIEYRDLDLSWSSPSNGGITPPSISNLLNIENITKFAKALGFAQRLGFGDSEELCIATFKIGGEKVSVQHIVTFILEDMVQKAWLELKDIDESLLPQISNVNWKCFDPTVEQKWRKCWFYIIWQKLLQNRADFNSKHEIATGSWFTETDRVAQDLLDIHPKYRTGRMCIIRVKEVDENLTLRDCLRSALIKLGLVEWISVIADVGGGSFDRQDKQSHLRSTSILKQLETWAKTRDLRHWLERFQDSSADSIEARATKSWRVQEEAERETAANKGKKSKRKELRSKYEDLENLPCIVILYGSGSRTGDTFPQSLRFLDLRLCPSQNYSDFVREFGPVCRYPRLRMDENGVHCLNSEKGSFTTEEVRVFLKNAGLEEFFENGGCLAVEDSTGEYKFVAESSLEVFKGLFEGRDSLFAREDSARIATKSTKWLFRRYVHRLPTILIDPVCDAKHIQRTILSKNENRCEMKVDSLKISKLETTVLGDNDNDSIEKEVRLEDPRRLLLIAPPQQGKTGVYLNFVCLLKDALKVNEKTAAEQANSVSSRRENLGDFLKKRCEEGCWNVVPLKSAGDEVPQSNWAKAMHDQLSHFSNSSASGNLVLLDPSACHSSCTTEEWFSIEFPDWIFVCEKENAERFKIVCPDRHVSLSDIDEGTVVDIKGGAGSRQYELVEKKETDYTDSHVLVFVFHASSIKDSENLSHKKRQGEPVPTVPKRKKI